MVLTAIGQICSTASMSHNLTQCQKLISKAVAAGAKTLFLPEASDYIASSPAESISLCLPAEKSPFVLGLQQSAKRHGLYINVGIHEPTMPPSSSSSRIANTLIWISPRGEIAHRYQKLHLFDIDLRDTGGPVMKESNSTEPGSRVEKPFVLDNDDGNANANGNENGELGPVGSMICFDLRFPEISLRLRRLGARVLVYPSAFTVPTGKMHWEVLLRARAVETQCWVVAAAQCGRHNGKRVSYGDSMVVDPTGKVVGRLDRVEEEEGREDLDGEREGQREPELLVVDVHMDVLEHARKMIPLENLRRTDVYPEI